MFANTLMSNNNRFGFLVKVTLSCFALFCEYCDNFFFVPCTVVGPFWQTAIKMYKAVGEERFLMWAVCSIQLQVLLTSFSINPLDYVNKKKVNLTYYLDL